MDLNLLKRLCETAAAPGREERMREVVIEVLRPLCGEITVDAIGNVIARKKGQGRLKLMVSSHMDEISFMVTHIDDEGFIRFTPLGGFDAKTLTSQRVMVHGVRDILGVMGSKPVHLLSAEERKVAPKIEDFFVDVGLPAAEVRAAVSIGDTITRQREMVEIGNHLNGKSFDNRIGVFVMIEAVRRLRGHEVDLYAVASAQEEIGIRGAQVAARNIDPDIGIALDVTLANDVPDAKPHEHVSRLGGGAAIKVMDSSVISHPRMVRFLRRVAQEAKIPFQMEVLPRGGTDTAALQRGGSGAAVGCISIPTRYVHSVIEMCSKVDIQAAISLLALAIEKVHEEDFSL
jgi:putative aminopeptidase FrvX